MRRLKILWVFALAASSLQGQNTRDQQREAPEVRKLTVTGVTHVDWRDLEKSMSTQATRCRSFLLEPFCLFSHSPTFEDKHYFDQQEFERDVLRIRLYYWKRGWRDVTVDTTVTTSGPRQVHVAFAVHENEPTRIARITEVYDSTLLNNRTRSRLTLLHAKDPLDLMVLDSMRTLFQGALWDQGYGDAVVDTMVRVDSVRRLADVTLTMTPNRRTTIGKITISGTSKVSPKTVLNSITFHSGDLYRQSSILESQRNLYESDLFRLVAIDVPPQYDSVKNVNIDVTEAALHDARVGPGINSVDFLQFQTHYSAFNLFGGARRLDVDGTVGNLLASSLEGRSGFRNVRADVPDSNVAPYLAPTYNASIAFNQPAFLRQPLDAVGFGAFTHRDINPGVYIDRGYGGTATLTHQFAIRAPVSLNYRYEVNRVQASDVYFCVDYGVCDTLTIGTLRSHQSLSPLTLTAFIDRSDQPFSPTKGYVARVDLEHASALTASDYRYNRLLIDAAAYTHRGHTGNPATEDVFAGHLTIGWVRPITNGTDAGVLHPRKRFYAGGANSVRGFAENMLGPRILTIDDSTLLKANSFRGGTCGLTVATVQYCDPNSPQLKNTDFLQQPLGGTSLLEGSVEFRFPLPLQAPLHSFVGAVFLDGAVVGSASIQGLQTLQNIVKGEGAVTPGFGIRYESPVGPIRVDVGINPGRAQQLQVVTAARDSTGQMRIVPLAATRNWSSGTRLLDRLVLHFSIGEAY